MLEDIKKRLEAATPGPWEISCDTLVMAEDIYITEIDSHGDDAELIANAPTDIAWLIAEVERLHNVVDVLRHEMDVE